MFHWGTTRRNIEGVSFGLRSLFSPPLSIVDVEEKTATLSFSLLDHLSKDQLSVRPTPHSWLSAQLAGLRRWFLCFNQPCATTPEGEGRAAKHVRRYFLPRPPSQRRAMSAQTAILAWQNLSVSDDRSRLFCAQITKSSHCLSVQMTIHGDFRQPKTRKSPGEVVIGAKSYQRKSSLSMLLLPTLFFVPFRGYYRERI
jgi:hypothetical protein